MNSSSALLSLALVAVVASAFADTPAHRRYGAWNSGRIGGGGYLQHASFSKTDPNRIYLASDVGGFYRTDDGGKTWHMLHGALPPGEGSTQIRGILAHPTQRDTFLIAAGSTWDQPRGVYRSDDAGATFTLTLPSRFEGNDGTRSDGFVIAADPSNPERVYAAPMGLGPQRSDDFGRTWRSLGLEDVYTRDLVIDRANPARIWINAANRGDKTYEANGTQRPFRHGLFVTTDGGATWERLPGDETPIEMVQDPVDAGLLHAAFRKVPQLRRSRDGGRTWEPYANSDIFPKPGDARADGTYAALATGPDFVLAGGHGGHVYRLAAGRDAWTKLADPTLNEGDWYAAATAPVERHFGAALGFIAVSPHNPASWLLTDWYACYLSPDSGATWNLAIDGIEMTVLHCLAQDPSTPTRVHAGMADIGYFRSDDGAETFPLWGRHAKISNNVKHISVCAAQPNRIYAVGPITWKWNANQTFRSDDAGTSWTRPPQRGLPSLADEGGRRCNTIAVHPANPDEVYLVVSGTVKPGDGGVYRSLNAGDDWEWIGHGLPETPLFRTDIWVSGPELAASADGTLVAMSNDRGRGFAYDPAAKRWTELALPHASSGVVADPQKPGRFYASLKDSGLFRSDDGGRNWRNVFGSFTAQIAVDGAKADRVAVSAGDAYWVSGDAGATWARIGEGLPSRHFRNSLCFAGERLICGTGGSGLFWTDLAQLEGAPVAKANDRTFAQSPALGGGESVPGGSVSTVPSSLIANGDMTAGGATPEGWSLSGGANEKRKLVRDTVHFVSAPSSLRVEVQSTAAVVQQRLAGNPGGKTLDASCRIRLDGTFKTVQFVLQCFDGGWKQVAWKVVAQTTKVGEWVELRGNVSIPDNASNVMCSVLVDGSGTVWLDDVAVVEAAGAAPAKAVAATMPLPQVISPDDPRLRYIGRFDRSDPAGPRAAWSCSAVTVRFRGRSLNAKLSSSSDDRVQVFVDGKDSGALVLKGQDLHRVADGLPEGEHVVTIMKRTEAHFGSVRFGGFQLEEKAELLSVEPAPYLLHAIGDSITAAYGNEAPGKDHHFSAVTENGADSFAAIAAREFGAEYTCVAWSGRKMWPDNTIGEVYGYALPWEKTPVDFKALRTPDAVVIGLSANDFRAGIPDEAGWTQAYADFIARVRRENAPGAQIYLIPSVLMYEKDKLEAFRRYIDRIIALRAEAGDTKVAYLHLPVQNIGLDGIGADWHPSVKTHRKNAELLAAALERDLGWKRLP